MEEECTTTDGLIDALPKYLEFRKVVYSLLIYKHDWNFTHEDSFQVYYAKQTKTGFNTSKPLLKAIGRTLFQALKSMESLLLSEKKKRQFAGAKTITQSGTQGSRAIKKTKLWHATT